MADDPINEDQWLYGESNEGTEHGAGAEQKAAEESNHEAVNRKVPEENEEAVHPPGESEDNDDGQEKAKQAEGEEGLRPPGEELEEGEDDDDSDDSDDNVQVTIGDIKATPQYGNLNIKRNAMLSTGIEKHKQAGKFSIDEFESIGTINGVAAHEYSIDALEEKPWRKPGADITDYFNYGFNEETWRAYCERQKSMRVHESGAGLGGLGVARTSGSNVTLTGDPKYGMVSSVANAVRSKAGPPPGPRRAGVIDVIGTTVASRRTTDSPPKENNVQVNSIQVMTADKRDYGRKTGYDMSVPPPFVENPGPMPPGYNPAYPPGDFYPPEMDPYYQQYDRPPPNIWPSQDKTPTSKDIMLPEGVVIKQEPPDKPPKERQSDRDRDRHKDRHRHRSRSRSTERRSRKHKSRSRSPSHRSHKKKKSKKSERERSRTRDDRDRSRTRDDRDRSRTRDTRDRSRSRDERDRSRTRDDRERSRDRDREGSPD